MTSPVAVSVSTHSALAAIFNLEDPNERRIFDAIQTYYGPDGCERLRALRKGSVDGPGGCIRVLWTLGSFHPKRKNAAVEWTVTYWHIDEIAVRFQSCKDETEARAVYKSAAYPGSELPGVSKQQ